MNCQTIVFLLDNGDLKSLAGAEEQAVRVHLKACPACAALWNAHAGFESMRIPPLPAGLKERCLAHVAGTPGARAARRRVGPFAALCFVGAAAAALLGTAWLTSIDDPVGGGPVSAPQPASTQPASGTGINGHAGQPDSETAASPPDEAIADDANAAGAPSAAAVVFTVELTRLVPAGATPQAIQFGDWFHRELVQKLLEVPNLVLIETDEPREIDLSRGGMSGPRPTTAAPPLFDPNPANWAGSYDFRMAAGVGLADNWTRMRFTAVGRSGGSSGTDLARRVPDGMTPAPEHAAAFAQEVVQELQVEVFPASASRLAQLYAESESVFLNQSTAIEERLAALNAAAHIAGRANHSGITARFVDSALALAPQLEDAASSSVEFAELIAGLSPSERAAARAELGAELRATVLRWLIDTADPRLIGPMTDVLLYDSSEDVRLVATKILGEYVNDAVARAALESAARSDSSEEVREAARALVLDEAGRLDDIVRTLRDTSLSDDERIKPIMYPGESLSHIASGFNFDPLTVDVIAELIARSEASATRRQVLLSLSTKDSPSLVPVFIERLRNDPSPEVRAAATVGLRRQQALSEARAALEAAATGDVSEEVRTAAARQLEAASP